MLTRNDALRGKRSGRRSLGREDADALAINVAVNDAPTQTGLAGDSVTFTENGAPVRLDAGLNAAIFDNDPFGHETVRVISGLADLPVFLAMVPDGSGRFFIVGKEGTIRIADPASGGSMLFLDVSSQILTDGEQGLLGFAVAPDFATSGVFYLHLVNLAGDTEVRRYRTMVGNPDLADPATADRILLIPHPDFTNHNGGWMGFGLDGNLYIMTGDAAVGANAQSLDTVLGKVLRIDPSTDAFLADPDRDYAIPAGNPFAGATPGRDEIWASGLRNPYRATFDPITGDLYIGDVGDSQREEIDLIPGGTAGLNFGWDIREGTLSFRGADLPAFTPPIAEYVNGDEPFQGQAVTAGAVYRGPIAGLDGKFIFGDFYGEIFAVSLGAISQGSTIASSQFERLNSAFTPNVGTIDFVASYLVDPEGRLLIPDYLGSVYRVQPSASPNFAGGRLTVQITANGVAGEDVLSLDTSAVSLTNGTAFGSQIFVGGVMIGTIAPNGTGTGGNPLDIAFSSGADAARVSGLLQAITYANSNGADPSTATRTITYTLKDGQGVQGGGQDTLVFTSQVAVTAIDDPSVAAADSGIVMENGNLILSVLANDSDPDGPAPAVAQVNGMAITVGGEVILPSGARVTRNGDGTLTYDTNGVFGAIPAPGSGASNTPGSDSFTYALAAGVSATVTMTITGIDTDDILLGTAGADALDGGIGLDQMSGLGGNDRYFVDNGDVAIEAAGAGTDRVFARTHYALGAGREIETLSTDDDAGTAARNLTGNELAQSVIGNAGFNILDGGGGGDTLQGFAGDDWYFVRAADLVREVAAGGSDRLFALQSYALNAGAHVELMSTGNHGGTQAIDLTGNELAQTIYGNAGLNILNGGGGGDELVGLGGSDWYFVRSGDTIQEAANGGFDRLFAFGTYALNAGASVELMSTTDHAGIGAINLTGNELAQTIYGNAGANMLNGGFSADELVGLGGADMFAFTTALGGGNIDRILDLVSGTDGVVLDDAIFAGLGLGALPASAFRVGAAAQDADDRVIYNQSTGALSFDADGNGGGAAIQFATLNAGQVLAASDFTVI